MDANRVRSVLGRLDEALGALDEARDMCDEIGEGAEEQRHDCSMAMGIIDEVAAVLESRLEPLAEPSAEPGDV